MSEKVAIGILVFFEFSATLQFNSYVFFAKKMPFDLGHVNVEGRLSIAWEYLYIL